jgi:hypothetical protein
MNSEELLIAGIIALIVNSLILYLIISFATNAKQRTAIELAQLNILCQLATHQGIPVEEIQKIIDTIK